MEEYNPMNWPDQNTYVCAETIDRTGSESLQISDMPSNGDVTIDGKTWSFLLGSYTALLYKMHTRVLIFKYYTV
jgi:hypothetical protein